MSQVPQDYSNQEVETWLLTSAYFHERGMYIHERYLLESLPQELLATLPTREHLIFLVWKLIRQKLLVNHANTYISASISDEGIFQFRKYLSPLYDKKSDEKFVNKVLDATTGDEKIRNKIKVFFKKNKELPKDEFDSRLRDFLFDLGKEGIFFVIRLIIKASIGLES